MSKRGQSSGGAFRHGRSVRSVRSGRSSSNSESTPGRLATLPESSEWSEDREEEGEWEVGSWASLPVPPPTPPPDLQTPFTFYQELQTRTMGPGLTLAKCFLWFRNAKLLDERLLGPTHLSLAFNELRLPTDTLTLEDFEVMLHLLCQKRLLRELVLKKRLADPRAMRKNMRARSPSTDSDDSSEERAPAPPPSSEFMGEGDQFLGEAMYSWPPTRAFSGHGSAALSKRSGRSTAASTRSSKRSTAPASRRSTAASSRTSRAKSNA